MSSDQKDALKFLQVFPAEVWLEILARLDDADYTEHLFHSDPFFRPLLFEQRQRFLFPKISKFLLPVLLEREAKNPTQKFKQTVPNLPRDILKLRQVCRKWNQGVNSYCENFLWEKCSYSLAGSVKFEFQNGYPSPLKFVEHFAGSHERPKGNPFLGRNLIIYCDNFRNYQSWDDTRTYLDDTAHLLEKYGQQIWYFSFVYTDVTPLSPETYSQVVELIELTPNLKQLNLYFSWNTEEVHQVLPHFVQPDYGNLERFPDIKSLAKVEMANAPLPVFNQVLSSYPNLKKVKIRCMEHPVNYNFSVAALPNLKELYVQCFSDQVFFSLENNPGLLSQLETLFLDLTPNEELDLNVARLFTLIGDNCGNTLTNLTLRLPPIWPLEQASILPNLNLTSLKHLTLQLGNYCTTDFLLPAKESLVNLELKFWFWNGPPAWTAVWDLREEWDIAVNAEKTVKFLGKIGNPVESNIWKVFGKLQTLKFEDWGKLEAVRFSYSRAEWE